MSLVYIERIKVCCYEVCSTLKTLSLAAQGFHHVCYGIESLENKLIITMLRLLAELGAMLSTALEGLRRTIHGFCVFLTYLHEVKHFFLIVYI